MLVFEPVQYFTYGLRWFRQHGLQWYARCQFALFSYAVDAELEQGRNNFVVGRQLT